MWSRILKIQILTCLVLMSLYSPGDCSRILALVPTTVKSHYVIMEPLLQALAARGHQVTVYSSFPQKTPLPNFTDVDCSNGTVRENNLDFAVLGQLMGNVFQAASHLVEFAIDDCEYAYNNLKLDNFDFENEKYDLVIAEMFAADCYVHFAHKLAVPFISIVTSVPLPWTPDIFGLPDNPSYIPNYLVDFHHDMSFFQRVVNTVVQIYSKLVFNFDGNPRTQRLVEKHISGTLPWVGDIARKSSLLLVNSHFSLSQSRPFPPNVVEIGGIHIRESKPLPKDLQEILDNSTQGVILLTFGARLLVSTIPEEKLAMMMRVFSKIRQTVLMKYESDLPNTPQNVIVRNWIPQRDVLEHKNVVAFISHGGLASVIEAVYTAKPVLGIPFFADQSLNLHSVAWKGGGVVVDLETLTEERFGEAVDNVVRNTKILEGMKRLSQQFRDRPKSALQSAVYWTEYVLRHKGAPHLRPASTTLSFYQLWLLDVIAKTPSYFMMRATLVLLALVCHGDCARILAIIPLIVKSHYILIEPLLLALASRGHHLTVYTSFPKTSSDNVTYVDCGTGRTSYESNMPFDLFDVVMRDEFVSALHLFNTVNGDCEFLYGESKFGAIANQTFDLVIAEMFASDCFVHIAYKLGVPLISISTNVPMPWTCDKFGLPDNPSYIPNSLSSYTPDMTFWQRVRNTLVIIYGKIMFKFVSNPSSQRYAEGHYKEPLPWVEDIAKNSSLLLVNSHFSLSHSRPLPPNVVEVGGMHIKEKQYLPKDLQEILDRSKKGVVLFTFGSIIRMATLPKEKIRMIMNVFSKIPQTVLMKYEEDLPEFTPKNVIARNWLPQRDILAHPNVVAFVSHAGLSSVMESVYESKPIVAVPFFSDQFLNTNTLVWKGAGVGVYFRTMTEQDFEYAVNEVLNNRTILEGMKRLSQQFRDRPLSALQSAVYWTEYILRHKGAPHLRPASTTLSFYQLWLLDVIAVLLAAIVAVVTSIYWTINLIRKSIQSLRLKHAKINKND